MKIITKKFIALICILTLNFSMCLKAAALTKTEENDYIKLERKTRHLHSRLSKDYTGYDYIIHNVYNEPVTIQSVSIWDNATSKVAYLSVKRTGARAAAETLGAGVALALPTLTLSLIGSVVAVPFILISNQIGNISANQEAQRYDKQLQAATTINPQESIELKTMALHRHAPSIRLIFVNPLTDENMELLLK